MSMPCEDEYPLLLLTFFLKYIASSTYNNYGQTAFNLHNIWGLTLIEVCIMRNAHLELFHGVFLH